MEEEINPIETVPGADGNDVVASESTVNDSQTVSLKDIVKELTGREYKDDEDAKKGIAETYKFVTKKMDDNQPAPDVAAPAATPQVDPGIVTEVETLKRQVQESNFYASNPEYNTPEARALISKFGGSPEEVIKDEVFQTAYGAIKANAEIEKSKSVLQSNPRLGQVTDKITQAREALQNGNQTVAETNAVSAVMEAYDMTK